jgi:hypothetical protein
MGIVEFFDYPKVQAVVNNPELMHAIWTTVVPDLKDLTAYLGTGKSAKYDPETILGRWIFDVSVALTMDLRTKPNISSRDMQRLKEWFLTAYSKTTFVAKTDHQFTLKNLPSAAPAVAGAAPASGSQNLQGQWKRLDGKYQISVSTAGREADLAAAVEGDRLTITGQRMNLVFSRED